MTLNTSIAVGKPLAVRTVFNFCRQLIDTPAEVEPREGDWLDGQRYITNPAGAGLCALMQVNYCPDGPMIYKSDDDSSDPEYDEYKRSEPTGNGWAAMEIEFDTAYGYQGENGESCSDLHARLVRAVGQWLDAQDVPWKWQNEYTGEWHDRYDGLAEFGDAHRSTGADEWFRNSVQPLIRSLSS